MDHKGKAKDNDILGDSKILVFSNALHERFTFKGACRHCCAVNGYLWEFKKLIDSTQDRMHVNEMTRLVSILIFLLFSEHFCILFGIFREIVDFHTDK